MVWIASVATAGSLNVAPMAKATASSCAEGYNASGINDGVVRIENRGEWVSGSREEFWGGIDFPWVRLDWEEPVEIDRVVLYNRVGADSHVASVKLRFSDGTSRDVVAVPRDGAPCEVLLDGVVTDFVTVEVTDGQGSNIGLSEVEVFPTLTSCGDYVSMVDPYVETVMGRYFFFITGCQPQGMIGAAPLTRNKNQGGGGYNYNDNEILGFPQIHAWMLSGLTFMPSAEGVNPVEGEQGWKSTFSHAGEIVRPGYHRVYLDNPGVWVE